MNKLLRLSFMLLLALISNFAMADAYKTLSFPDDNSENNMKNGVGYNVKWDAKIGDDSWEITNFNNNGWNGNWTYIRCGSKSGASMATIVNGEAYDAKVASVVVTMDKVDANLTKASLVVSSDAEGINVVETVTPASFAAGDVVFNVTTPTAGCYYKLVFDCAKGTNGFNQISKIQYFEDGDAPVIVDITNTPDAAYTVTEAKALIDANKGLAANVYVEGKIVSIKEISTQFGNATYDITDGENTMTVYRGYDLEGAKFTSEDALHVGDDVVVYGQLLLYNGTYELATGNKLYSVSCNAVAETVSMTASYENGQVVLTYEDYADGGVEPGEGTIEVWNEVSKVATLVDGALGEGYNQVVYSLSNVLEDGVYTIKVPAGAVVGNKADGWGDMEPIAAAEANIEITTQQNPDGDQYLGEPAFEVVAGEGVVVKYIYPNSTEDSWNTYKDQNYEGKTCVLYEDEVQVATVPFAMNDLGNWNYVLGAKFDYTAVEGKTYKVVFPAGCYYIYTMDDWGNITGIIEESKEQSYTWVAGANPTPGGAGDGDCVLAYGVNSSNEKNLTLTWPEGTMLDMDWFSLDNPSLDGFDGFFSMSVTCSTGDPIFGTNDQLIAYVALADGDYILNIPAGKFTVNGSPLAAQAISFSIVNGELQQEVADNGTWVFESVSPAEGAVQELQTITFAYPASTGGVNESPYINLVDEAGNEYRFMLSDDWYGNVVANYVGGDNPITASGTYTMVIPSGTFTGWSDPSTNKKMTYTWTIGGGEGGGNNDDENPGDIDDDKWQEKIFAQGTAVAIPLNIETEGVTVTSVGREFMGTVIDVSYDLYEEGELDWKTGTQLVFTAKDNITGIVIDGQFKEFASSDKGNYVNGAWTGLIKAGETVTLTSNDGINIHSIVVLYNGAELQIEDVDDKEIATEMNIIKSSWATIGKIAGEVVGTISTDAEPFARYMFEIRCEEDEAQYISFNDLLTKEGNIVCTSPTSAGYDLFKGQHYTLTAYVYDTPQYGALPVDVVEYKFVGEGKEPVIYSEETVASVDLKESTDGICQYICEGLSFNITFSAPMSSVSAVSPQGMDGSVKLTATKANETGTVWTITVPESLKNGSSETEMPTASIAIVAKDAESHVLKTANEDHPYEFVIGFYTPAVSDIATLTIGENVYTLSEESAIELAAYPAGAVIAINNDDEAIKKISYEVVDKTLNEIIKSQGDLTKGTDGIWRAEMPKTYELAKGHEYSIHVMARNGMSSFTSQMIYEYNFLVNGTANVATYSAVKVVEVTPSVNDIIRDANQVVSISFSEAIASLDVVAVLGQMSSVAVASANVTTEDNITWNVQLKESYFSDGSLSLNFTAIDKQGNRVTDEQNGVGIPENCYVNYGWASTIGLPTPTMAENGKSVEVLQTLTFKYDGIGLNQDMATATWKDIVVEKEGVALDLAVEESQFEVQGEDAGNALVWTLPEPLYKGVYTIKVPAYALMLGHDQSNFYNGACEFTVTATAEEPSAEPEIALNITKTDWSKIGNQNGEVIGKAELLNAEAFDHIEAEIRCQEDADQFISFSNMMVNGGNLTCFAWEGGSYTLNKGYHYTLTVNAFDVPYYGATPVATATYEFVGTGAEAVKYCDIELAKVDLPENALLYHGYDLGVTSFDVTFSAPVSKVNVWGAMGMDGSIKYSAEKKSADGTVWTIVLDENILGEEGSVNLMIQAWDAEGVQAKGWNGEHAFDMNLIINLADAIKSVEMAYAGKTIYTMNGVRIKSSQMKKGQVYIVNGVKVLVK